MRQCRLPDPPSFGDRCIAGVTNKIADTLVWALFPVYFRTRHLDWVQIGWLRVCS